MSQITKRVTLSIGIASLMISLAGVAFVAGQHVSAQGPGFSGPGGQGGPGAPGGPMGRGRRGGPGGPFAGPGMLGAMMLDRLDLSQAQRDRVKDILDSHRADQQALGERARKAHDALDAATTNEVFNEGAVRAAAADVAAVDADMAVAHAGIYAEIFQVLTADQQSQLKKMQADMHARQQQMIEKRQNRRGGK